MMPIAKVIFSLVLPPSIWLVYGAPDLHLAGNLAIISVVILHLYVAIWFSSLFGLFRGDGFTYGFATLAINSVLFASSFLLGWVVLLRFEERIEMISSISPFIWGFICLGILATISIPLVTNRYVTQLASESDRRAYKNPCDSDK